jgi:hypothetical protein
MWVEVTIVVARFAKPEVFGGRFRLVCGGREMRYGFRAELDGSTCVFTELRCFAAPDASSLEDDDGYVFFAHALSKSVAELGRHQLRKRLAAGRLFAPEEENLDVASDDLGVTIQLPFDPQDDEAEGLFQRLLGGGAS